jgi:hypothetical protein
MWKEYHPPKCIKCLHHIYADVYFRWTREPRNQRIEIRRRVDLLRRGEWITDPNPSA